MKKGKKFYFLAFAFFALLVWAYSNHFHNPFQFDDDHTIGSNNYIRQIKNIPLFFKDATTTSSLPASQSYRPGVTTLNAIDYWIGGQLEPVPFYYHISIFISYIFLGVLLFFFFFEIFNNSVEHKWNKYFALFATALFCLHTANAETINYIIARSDSFSTLMVALAFVVYQYKPNWRSTHIYLIPAIAGFFVKEVAVVFGLLLLIYKLLIEEQLSFKNLISFSPPATIKKILIGVAPALLAALLYYVLFISMRPSTWNSGGGIWYHYLITQPFVIVHYIINFILPLNLSADTDWELVTSFSDERFLIGSLIIIGLVALAFRLSNNRLTRPIAFGIFWFFIALLPTSSIFSLAEVLNDHRPFFPYIGLALAVVWSLALFVMKHEERIRNSLRIRTIAFGVISSVIIGHAYGTHQRNMVWSSGENLWYDVTVKSPKNARGLMNYGNTQMAKANYSSALDCFERALKLWPTYSYLYINMGVLKSAMGQQKEALQNFKKAISLNPVNPEAYYYFAKYLKEQGEVNEAKETIAKGLAMSPGHISSKRLLNEIIASEIDAASNIAVLEQEAAKNPSPENYLNLSLNYYKEKKYEKCIEASLQALKLKPDYAIALNNICSAYNILGNYDAAIKAGKEAIRINPDFELAKNNLKEAIRRKSSEEEMLGLIVQQPTFENYINLSLLYYNNGRFEKSIEASENALRINPKSDIAYNNICSAYNMLKQWDKAIFAGEKGLSINPESQLIKNNLAVSRESNQAKTN